MKRLVMVIVIGLLLLAVFPVHADGNGPAPGSTCGVYYGQHIAEHAQEGHFGPDHNPGQEHQGFANFAEHPMEEQVCP